MRCCSAYAVHSGPKVKKTSCTLCLVTMYRLREEAFFIHCVEGMLGDSGEDAREREDGVNTVGHFPSAFT